MDAAEQDCLGKKKKKEEQNATFLAATYMLNRVPRVPLRGYCRTELSGEKKEKKKHLEVECGAFARMRASNE